MKLIILLTMQASSHLISTNVVILVGRHVTHTHTYHYYLPLQAYLNDVLATKGMRITRSKLAE